MDDAILITVLFLCLAVASAWAVWASKQMFKLAVANDDLLDENSRLKKMNLSLANRVSAQSDLLSRAAERSRPAV